MTSSKHSSGKHPLTFYDVTCGNFCGISGFLKRTMSSFWVLLFVCVVNNVLAGGNELERSCITEIEADVVTHAHWTNIPVDLTDDEQNKQMKEFVDMAVKTINKQKSLDLQSPTGEQLQDQLQKVYVKVNFHLLLSCELS